MDDVVSDELNSIESELNQPTSLGTIFDADNDARVSGDYDVQYTQSLNTTENSTSVSNVETSNDIVDVTELHKKSSEYEATEYESTVERDDYEETVKDYDVTERQDNHVKVTEGHQATSQSDEAYTVRIVEKKEETSANNDLDETLIVSSSSNEESSTSHETSEDEGSGGFQDIITLASMEDDGIC